VEKSDIRTQVTAAIADVIREAEAHGRDGFLAASRAFPGAPGSVIAEVWTGVDLERNEAWWQSVERTIDGELVKRAIATAGQAGSGEQKS
jgi:hypothetical protein